MALWNLSTIALNYINIAAHLHQRNYLYILSGVTFTTSWFGLRRSSLANICWSLTQSMTNNLGGLLMISQFDWLSATTQKRLRSGISRPICSKSHAKLLLDINGFDKPWIGFDNFQVTGNWATHLRKAHFLLWSAGAAHRPVENFLHNEVSVAWRCRSSVFEH